MSRELLSAVHGFLVHHGFDKSASKFVKEARLEGEEVLWTGIDLEDATHDAYVPTPKKVKDRTKKRSKAVAVEEEPEVVAELPLVKKPKVKFSDPLPVSVEPVKKSKKVVEEEPIRPSNGNKSLKSDGKAAVHTKPVSEGKEKHEKPSKAIESESEEEEEEQSGSEEDDDEDDEEEEEEEEDEEEEEATLLRIESARKKKASEAAKAAALWLERMDAVVPTKSSKKSEPRVSGEAFRRVDADLWNKEIVTGLEDNSYEKQFGEDGYGYKASAVLMQVRGKDFRHEKTKKKRGSYRGGTISMESNSFKYDD